MKKFAIILIASFYLLISAPVTSEARQHKRSQYEDTVTEAIWDWVTTLGKSPQEKKRTKAHRRVDRAKKRADKKAKIKREKLHRENEAREREAEKMRQARLRAQRRKIERKKRQLRNRD